MYCNPLADFPMTGYLSSGGYAHVKIISCGGNLTSSVSQSCYYFSENNWELFGDLTDPREYHGKLDNIFKNLHPLQYKNQVFFDACR